MSEGTIATVDMATDGPPGLDAAIATARRLSMHLDVYCVAPVALQAPAASMADAFVPLHVAETHARELAGRVEAVRARLEREDINWSVEALPMAPDALSFDMARHLRFADMVLLPRSGAEPGDIRRLFDTILYTSRVPILLTDTALGALERVVVAWDESDVALAAARAALPVLREAGTVEIVTVDMPEAGQDLARMLSRWGVSPVLTQLARGEASIADTLLLRAAQSGAELIVAGAYGHARLRELLLGGVTRSLLSHAEQPLLLAR